MLRVATVVLFAFTLVLVTVSAVQAQIGTKPPKVSPVLEEVRAALDRYRDPIAAVHDGYFSTLGCVHYPEGGGEGEVPYAAGGMGVHFFNVGLVSPVLDSLKPQVLIYEPVNDTLRLVAAEWFVPLATGVTERPTLFGHPMDGPMEGHHPLMPQGMHHWDLHVWLWKDNPVGLFSPTNPSVTCPDGVYSIAEKAPKIVGHSQH